MIGFGCFDASNGGPGGGVCAKVSVELKSPAATRKVRGRNIATIIINRVEATVRAIFVKREKRGRSVSLQSVQALAGGLDGDHHTGLSKRRQILLVSGNVLDELNLEAGAISENVVVDGMDVMALKEGQQLRLGNALVTVTIPCEPCVQMDRVRGGLRDALHNRRGMFVSVLAEGTVCVGDRVLRM
jgi:MOSC domain-containing protein YiiM